jgi:hypothetical protein
MVVGGPDVAATRVDREHGARRRDRDRDDDADADEGSTAAAARARDGVVGVRERGFGHLAALVRN